MTTASVKSKIRTAMADAFITRAEARTIVTEAEKGRVTVGEAKAVADLFDRATQSRRGDAFTLAIPENPGDVTLEQGAKNVMEAFFAKHNIPAGPEKAAIKSRINNFLATVDLGAPNAKQPNEKSLFAVHLNDPRDVLRDIPLSTALIDLKKGEFYLKVEGGFVADPTAKYWGPMKIPAQEQQQGGLSSARVDQIRRELNKANLAGTLNYQPGGVIESHLGVRFERVELMRERHPDGFTYTAYVPVGALSPTAPQRDPNTVREVYVERSGGFAGLTEHVLLNL
jgi:hypothetical protein